MTAVVYVLTSLESGRLLGFGLICPEARYCSVRRIGVDQLDRRFPSPRQWRQLEGETARGLEAGPLPSFSAVARVLGDSGTVLQYVHAAPIDAAPADVAATLDAYLRQQQPS